MNRSLRALTVLALLALGTAALLPTAAAALPAGPTWQVVFYDDFEGSALDPAQWAANPHTGVINVAGSAASFSGAGVHFPYADTTSAPETLYKEGEEFRTVVDFEYTNFGPYGAGLSAPMFSIWQDSAIGGTIVSIAGQTVHVSANQRHLYAFAWDGSAYTIEKDGFEILNVPSASPPTAGGIRLGNNAECCASPASAWNSFKVHSISSEAWVEPQGTPLPELTTMMLMGIGLVATAAVVVARRK